MNYTTLIGDIGFLTGASTADYSSADRTTYLNHWYHKVITMILDAQDEWNWDDSNQTDYPIGTTDLVAGQQDYTFPASLKILKIQRVEYSPDGTNWYKVQPFDINERQLATDSASLTRDFQATSPYYDIQANSIFLYPVPTQNVTGGLKVWFQREPVEFTTSDTTKEPGIDEAWHRMLSVGASLEYAIAKNLPHLINTLSPMLQDYEARLRSYYSFKDADRKLSFGSAYYLDSYGR